MSFKLFLETEEENNVKSLITKLPKGHQKLLNGFKIRFTPGNTLHGDNGHVGYIHKTKIVVAAPWHYSRSMTFMHEVAHLIFEQKMTPKLKKEWSELLKNTKPDQIKKLKEMKLSVNALDQNSEEIFCMVYASTYIKHPPITYLKPEWQDFIKNKVPD
jgi:hypothetical protein